MSIVGAVAAEALEQIVVGREIQILQDDLAPRSVEGEARRDDRLRDRRVLVHRDRVARRRRESARAGCRSRGRSPTSPRATRARRASSHSSANCCEIRARPPRHRAERVADQVRAGVEDRKLGSPGSSASVTASMCRPKAEGQAQRDAAREAARLRAASGAEPWH